MHGRHRRLIVWPVGRRSLCRGAVGKERRRLLSLRVLHLALRRSFVGENTVQSRRASRRLPPSLLCLGLSRSLQRLTVDLTECAVHPRNVKGLLRGLSGDVVKLDLVLGQAVAQFVCCSPPPPPLPVQVLLNGHGPI